MNTLFLFLLTSLALTLLPGPDILFVITTSMHKGWKKGIKLSLGLTFGIILHTFFVVAGLGSILTLYPEVIRLIEFSGAAYLIYLSLQSWRVKSSFSLESNKKVNQNLFVTGLIMNLSNPKVTLFFLSFFTGFLFHESWSYAIQFFVLGGIFFAQALFIFSSCSILAYRMGKKLKLIKHSDIWDKVQALILFVIALILIYP